MPRALSRLVITVSAAAALACASAAARPRLTRIAPDSVQLMPGNVTEVDLRGSGFDTSRVAPHNTVQIGSVVLTAVPSGEGGTRIRVAIPTEVRSRGEAAPSAWISGRYAVTVATPKGTSDTLMIAITAGGRLP